MKMLLTSMGSGMGSLNAPDWGSGPNLGLNSRGSEKKASQTKPCIKHLNRNFPVLTFRSDRPWFCFMSNQLGTNIG